MPSLQSSGFCLYCEVDLGSVLINPLSVSTMPNLTAQTGCGPVFAKSKQRDLSAVWHFMMSVTGDGADLQLAFAGYLGAKTATQIVRLRTNIQYFLLTNTWFATIAVQFFFFFLLLCVLCLFICLKWVLFFSLVYANTIPHS